MRVSKGERKRKRAKERGREEERKSKRVKMNEFYRVSFPLVQYLSTRKRISIDRANV